MDYFDVHSPTESMELPLESVIEETLSTSTTTPPPVQFPGSNLKTTMNSKPVNELKSEKSLNLSSTSANMTILDKELIVPQASYRFLHGGQPLFDVNAPSVIISTVSNLPSAVSSSWRPFTDDEEIELEKGWKKLHDDNLKVVDQNEEVIDRDEEDKVKENDYKEDDIVAAHIIPVGLDKLFSVNLKTLILSPDFWQGTPVRTVRSLWFYSNSNSTSTTNSTGTPTPSHLLKCYPVDPVLADALEKAYHEIKPWNESYSEELRSALKLGPYAEAKLRVTLLNPIEGGSSSGIEVIFQDSQVARVYSTGLIGNVSKNFFSSGQSFGGGKVVLRGWEAVRNWKKGKGKKVEKKEVEGKNSDSEVLDEISSSTPPPGTPSPSKSSTPTPSTSKLPTTNASPSLFETLRSKLGVAASALAENRDALSKKSSSEINDTTEAMDGLRNKEDGVHSLEDVNGNIPEPDELVLVIHGIGQKLAGSFDSINFLHCVNQLRKNCTTLSTSSLAPLIHSKRAQFIPVRWRADLEFDDLDETQDSNEENLDNRFSIDDIELDSVPFLRQVVSGLVLDVPFYLSHHKQKMINAVVKDANRIYRMFCARNPSFAKNGKVSIIAHSLGSALTADILSTQLTFVKPLSEMSREEKNSQTQFIFDTRNVFLVGSPLAFFLHLGKGQLIARRGRERTSSPDLPRDTALDRPRYGCLSCDAVYNIYNSTDPVAFSLNPTVDSEYAKIIKPIAIPSSNKNLVQNLSETYNKVSKLFEFDFDFESTIGNINLWGTTNSTGGEVGKDNEKEKENLEKVQEKVEEEEEELKKKKFKPSSSSKRPGIGLKRMPSERPMSKSQFVKISRAERRFNALNPQGSVDFYLPTEGVINQYLESITSHNNYWSDPRFSTFILTQLFASTSELEKTGRDELSTED